MIRVRGEAGPRPTAAQVVPTAEAVSNTSGNLRVTWEKPANRGGSRPVDYGLLHRPTGPDGADLPDMRPDGKPTSDHEDYWRWNTAWRAGRTSRGPWEVLYSVPRQESGDQISANLVGPADGPGLRGAGADGFRRRHPCVVEAGLHNDRGDGDERAGVLARTAAGRRDAAAGEPVTYRVVVTGLGNAANWRGVAVDVGFGWRNRRKGEDIVPGVVLTTDTSIRAVLTTDRMTPNSDTGDYWEKQLGTVPDDAVDRGPLTASFEGLPTTHDGETAFTFRIAFSEAVDITAAALRNDALEVTGGTATAASQVDGDAALWEITVEPDSAAEVSISLPPTTDCAATGAVCTTDDRPLSTGFARILLGPPPGLSVSDAQAT